jgi:hypothetical protein
MVTMLIASILAKTCGLHARSKRFPGEIVTGIKPVKIGAAQTAKNNSSGQRSFKAL